MTCPKAPRGWYCTRRFGHDGPCAANPHTSVRLWRMLTGKTV